VTEIMLCETNDRSVSLWRIFAIAGHYAIRRDRWCYCRRFYG